MEVAEQDGATNRQELAELHTPQLLLRSCLNASASPPRKHQEHQLTNMVPSTDGAKTNR